jgi:hypothetical protein
LTPSSKYLNISIIQYDAEIFGSSLYTSSIIE